MVEYNSTYDGLFGTTLLIISILGAALNLFGFTYFISCSRKSTGNSLFFKRLYTVITLTDTLICVSMTPVVEAAFASSRNGAMFSNDRFCLSWTILWTVLPQLSVFMVGVLSVTRLALLAKPTLKLQPWVALVLPALSVTWSVASSIGLLLGVGVTQRYYTDWLGCNFNNFRPEDMDRVLTAEDLSDGLILRVVLNVLPALSPIPISISTIMSMVILRRSMKCAQKLSGSGKQHVESTKTVILFAFVYIILNIPYICALIFFLLIWNNPDLGTITVSEYEEGHKLPDTVFLRTFLIAIVSIATININSFINPLLYFWRMDHFRKYVLRRKVELLVSITKHEGGGAGGGGGMSKFESHDMSRVYTCHKNDNAI